MIQTGFAQHMFSHIFLYIPGRRWHLNALK